ncbi:MAG: Holliday junction branch migration protein RuvA [Actinomycetales bacterium]
MIAMVRGRVMRVGHQQGVDAITVDLGMVGVTVLCTQATAILAQPGAPIELATSLVVREDSLTLYGFAEEDERAVFEQVQTVSGVGPRLALGLLSTLTPDELRRAVSREDLVALTKVPGIGRKGAGRLVLELKDRLGAPVDAGVPHVVGAGWADAVRAGLVSLGWSAREADSAVAAVGDLADQQSAEAGSPDVAQLLKAALRTLDRTPDPAQAEPVT